MEDEENGEVWEACKVIEQRMTKRTSERTLTTPGSCVRPRWHGDDLDSKNEWVGCRVAEINAAKKIFSDRENVNELVSLMNKEKIDIQVITEPGKADGMSMAALKNQMIRMDMAAEIRTRGQDTAAGGQVILIGRKWAKLQRKVHEFKPSLGDRDRILAIEFDNRKQGHHNKLLLIGYYGYNDAPSHREEIKEMHQFMWCTMKKFRKQNPFGSVVILGDTNAAEWSDLDTDSEYVSGEGVSMEARDEEWEPERDSFVIEHLLKMKMCDAIRERYPSNNFVTRRATHHTNRFLDRVFVSKELATDTMRAAIYQPGIFTHGGVDTDHKMVVVDLPIDCAGEAASRVQLWSKHKKETLRWDADDLGEIAQEKIQAFNEQAAQAAQRSPPGSAKELLKWLNDASDGTVMKRVLQEFPKKARETKNFQSEDWKMRTNLKRTRESIRKLEHTARENRQIIRKALAPLKKITKIPHGPQLQESLANCLGKTRGEILVTLIRDEKEMVEYLSKSARKDRQESIAANKRRRTSRFQHGMKKRLKQVITSIMRRARTQEEVTSCIGTDGGEIKTSAKDVAAEVIKFYKDWMKSKVDWRQRWTSWKDMMAFNTNGLVDQADKDFIELAYKDSFKKFDGLQQAEGIWDAIWDPITLDTVKSTLRHMKSGTAGGPSGLTYDVLKALDDFNLEHIRAHLQQCLDERGIPRELNRSLLRPLPKTDAGLSDLALTRPIALIEVLGKLFEKILFDRILKTLVRHEMLDSSQHGGMPMRSTAAPIHTLAEVMQDAQMSGNELHVVSADLTKAFDTLEYWSQAMSWRALGMPMEMTEMLMRMDQEAETSVILGQGRTTADVLGEDGWFVSGRGVRQGSIGGPIKWIVYMNFWLRYMHKKHQGEGFKMAFSEDGDEELIGQMFIDDSNWLAGSAGGIQSMMSSNEKFVEFHGLSFNKKKCEYIVMNQRGDETGWERPHWSTGEILVETIRTEKDPRNWHKHFEESGKELQRIKSTIHHLRARTSEKARPAGEQLVVIDHIHEAMKAWELRAEGRWWRQDEPQTEADKLEAKALEETLQELLRETYDLTPESSQREAAHKIGRWQHEVKRGNNLAIKKGRAVRYLGVWYEEGFKWKTQRKILRDKFKLLNDNISHSAPTREEAVYCINATMNAAMKYPLRVASMDATSLKAWDTANRKTTAKAGGLPSMSPLAFHLPKELGGMGLESLELAVDRNQIEAYVEAINGGGLTGEIMRAGRRRYQQSVDSSRPEQGTTHAVIEATLEKHGWEIIDSETTKIRLMQHITKIKYPEIALQMKTDRSRANRNENRGRTWEAYGDGATYESEDRAGWGLWITARGPSEETKALNGRLAGAQNNDGAEAEAILQALLNTNPGENMSFFSDNQGCIRKWRKLGTESTLKWGYRAIWNRIHKLKDLREANGTTTNMNWVHSHVDDEERRTQRTAHMACACRENGEQECDPNHRHHIGNEKADTEAKKGAYKHRATEVDEVAKGEFKFALHSKTKGDLAQGAYGEWMTKQMNDALIERASRPAPEMESRNRGELQRLWARGALETDRKVRKASIKALHNRRDGASWRFWIRASLGVLPTMSRMAKFATAGGHTSTYSKVYADHIGEEGKCTTCGHSKETVEHALWECKAAKEQWENVDLDLWHKWDRMGLDWDVHDWKRSENQPCEWHNTWGILGMVPCDTVQKIAPEIGYRAAFALVRDTAIVHSTTSASIWEGRNKRHLEWETSIPPLAEEKMLAKKTTWNSRQGPLRRQKRPNKEGPETREQAEKRRGEEEKRNQGEEARRRTQHIELARNEQRKRAKLPILTADDIVREADREAAKAISQVTKRLRTDRANRTTESSHLPMKEMKCGWTHVRDAAPMKLLHAKPQEGQVGWWIPDIGTKIKAFWCSTDGKHSLGGTRGEWHPGIVCNTRWEEGELPETMIEYGDGHQEWHCTSTAGTSVILEVPQRKNTGGKKMVTDTMPEVSALRLGPGTRISVRWPRQGMAHSWWEGRVVANEGTRVAVRYMAAEGEEQSIVWHTDLHSRGTRLREIVRMVEGANEAYQLATQQRTRECVLLTDDGLCECAWCYTKGWPSEIEQLEAEGLGNDEIWELRNLDPREGRKRVKKYGYGKSPCVDEQVEEHGSSNGAPDERDMRCERRAAESERAAREGRSEVPETRGCHRPREQSRQDQRLDRRPGEQRRGGPHTGGMDGPQGEGPSRDETPDISDWRPTRGTGSHGHDELRGGKSGADGLGGRARGASEERSPGRPQEREEVADADGQTPSLDPTGDGIDGRSHLAADGRWPSSPRSGPISRLGQRDGEVVQRERMDEREHGITHRTRQRETDPDERAGKHQRRTEGLEPDIGPGRGLGIDRDSGSGGGDGNDRSGQRGSAVPGDPPRPHQSESEYGLLNPSPDEPLVQNSEKGGGQPGQGTDGLALPGVHPSVQSEQHEQIEGLGPRPLHRIAAEPGGRHSRKIGSRKGEVLEVPRGSGAADESPGRGGHSVCAREPDGQPLLGTGIGQAESREDARERLETPPGGPVRLWEALQEAHDDPHEHQLDPERPDERRQVQDRQVLRNSGEHPGHPGCGEARPTDCGRPEREANQNRTPPQGNEGGILNPSSQESSGNHAGAGDPTGGQSEPQQAKSNRTDRRLEEEGEVLARGASKRRKLNDGTREKRKQAGRNTSGAGEETPEPRSKRTRNRYVDDRTGVG